MKSLIVFFACVFLSACSFKQVTEVSITNSNAYPIAVTITVNNISQTYAGIAPHAKVEKVLDWSNIEKQDGHWAFSVMNEQTHGIDTFTSGFFTEGALAGYATLISEGSELKVQISE